MADVDMTDAPVAAPVAKTKKGGASGDADSSSGGKQRFEVKKVRDL
jgi:RING-box protein 1